MTTDNHTAITSGAAADAATFNSPLGELDAAIGDLTSLTTTEKGSAVGAINEVVAVIPSDGDKGDITISGSGTVWTIDNSVVSYAKIQNVSATDRLLGRDTAGAGVVEEISPTAARTMLNVEDGAQVTDATKVNAAGAVMETDYNANSILAATADDTPAVLTVAEQTLVGRITAGAIAALSTTQIRTLINVEDGADVTDTTNVTSAGALMDSEVDADLKTFSLPASTTISAFGRTLVDDADAATARGTLSVTSTKIDDFSAGDDNTDLNASTARHGLLLKLDGNTSNFLRGDGTWATSGAGTGATTALDNLASVAINTSLISDTDATDSLGSAAVKWLEAFVNRITIEEGGSTTTPAASDVALYAKADGLLYSKDDAGAETLVSAPLPAMVLISDTLLTSDTATIDLASIPQTYRHLVLMGSARTDQAATLDNLRMRVNNNSTADDHAYQYLYGNAATTSAAEGVTNETSALVAFVAGANAGAAYFSTFTMWINDYTNASKAPTFHCINGAGIGVATGNLYTTTWAGLLDVAGAVTRLTFFPSAGSNIADKSRITLYGVL